jgi:hypothetical protein
VASLTPCPAQPNETPSKFISTAEQGLKTKNSFKPKTTPLLSSYD